MGSNQHLRLCVTSQCPRIGRALKRWQFSQMIKQPWPWLLEVSVSETCIYFTVAATFVGSRLATSSRSSWLGVQHNKPHRTAFSFALVFSIILALATSNKKK